MIGRARLFVANSVRPLFAALVLALSPPASAEFHCTGEDRYVLQLLGYSEGVAARLCADERNMKEVRRQARKNFERAKPMKVYRGVYVAPEEFRPVGYPGTGVWVSSDPYGWPIHKAFMDPLAGAPGARDIAYATLVEYELPGYLFPSRNMSRAVVPTDLLPKGEKSLLIYMAKVGKVDVAAARTAKANGKLRYHDCVLGMLPADSGLPRLVEWLVR